MRPLNRIILHCSDSPYGDVTLIDQWHRERGWDGVGYHYVILNGYPDEESYRLKRPRYWTDGVVQDGRPLQQEGAHSYGHNRDSVGVCLIGRRQFTYQQIEALINLIRRLREQYPALELIGHYEAARHSRSCPNIDMDWLRELIKGQRTA